MSSAMVKKDPRHTVKKTPWNYLSKPITHLASDNNEADTNSIYEGPAVTLSDIKEWEDFCVDEEIAAMLQDTKLSEVLNSEFTDEQLEEFTWGVPRSGGKISEQTFERLWASVVHALNTIQWVCAASREGHANPTYLVIGDGSCATRKAPEAAGFTERKKPDFAGYELVPGSKQYTKEEIKLTPNRFPGDAKLFRKIRRAMLPPDGKEYLTRKGAKTEAQKVMNQIHDYMDQHEARYGYVVNDQELILLKRRGTGWGHMDISPAIRHDVETNLDEGIVNSKVVLFYYHFTVCQDEAKWRLRSCRSDAPPVVPAVKVKPKGRVAKLDGGKMQKKSAVKDVKAF